MVDKRIAELEGTEINPVKNFLPDFDICKDPYVHTMSSSKDLSIGEQGMSLMAAVITIPGVRGLTLSRNHLKVSKHLSHTWEEITPKIRDTFRAIFGGDIKFIGENFLILKYRRLKAQLDNR